MIQDNDLVSIIERLAKLEMKVHLKFEDLDRALILARQQTNEEKVTTSNQIAVHFKDVNNFQARIDKLVELTATRDWTIDKIANVEKIMSDRIGVVAEKCQCVEKAMALTAGESKWSDHLITAIIAVAVFVAGYVITRII